MEERTEIVLDGVNEYNEGDEVKLKEDYNTGRLCVVALNEGGYNSTWVDARQLYDKLKEFFGD